MSTERTKVVHAVTSSLSLVLLRGQLEYLRSVGFDAAALSGPGPFEHEMRGSAPVFTVPMEREIAPVKDLISLARLWRVLRQIRPEVCNAGTPKAGLLVNLAAWMARVPCRIYTVRGLRLETSRGWKRRILSTTEWIACRCANRVVCVSESLRGRMVQLKLVRAEKTLVLGSGSSNGIDAGRFVPSPDRISRAAVIRRELGMISGPVIGFIGRITRDKGIPELVGAFAELRQEFQTASLLLIGDYEVGDPIPAQVRARIEAREGIIRIPFQYDIAPYYLAMDVFVLPTHREGFPSTVLEAQAAERPVVTTNATGAVNSVVDGVTGLVVPVGDARSLTAAIRLLLRNRTRAYSMGRAGRERAERDFSRERIWGELVALYATMLQERGLHPPAGTVRHSKASPAA